MKRLHGFGLSFSLPIISLNKCSYKNSICWCH